MPEGWKAAERAAAALVGGVRSWSSEEDVDILVPNARNPTHAIEVKWRKSISLGDIEHWLDVNQAKCDKWNPPLGNGLLLKRKGGRGKPTRWLAVFPIADDVDKTINDERINE